MASLPQAALYSRQFVTSLVSGLVQAQEKSPSNTANPLAAVDHDNIKDVLLTLHALFPTELLAALDLLDRRLVHCFHLVDGKEELAQDEKTNQQASDRSKRRRLDDPDPNSFTDANTSMDANQTRPEKLPAADCENEAATSRAETTQAQHDVHELAVDRSSSPTQNKTLERHTKHAGRAYPGTVIPNLYYVQSAQQHRAATRARWRDDHPTHYEVRLTAWSCSCPAFSFSAFPPDITSHEHDQQPNDNNKTAFGGVSFGDELPICKHLLACYLAATCHNFKQFVEVRSSSLEEIVAWAAGWGD